MGVVRDGDSVSDNGVTYQLTQRVTDRGESTYENVLTITEELSSLVDRVFTCQVENVLGLSVTSEPFMIPGKIATCTWYISTRIEHKLGDMIFGGLSYSTVGVKCTSAINISHLSS